MKKIKDWIAEMQKTERGKTILKFSSYMIFFVAVLLFVMIANATNNSKSTVPSNNENNNVQDVFLNNESSDYTTKTLTYLEKQKKLYEGEYDFTYKISGEITLQYSGTYKKGLVTGYKQSSTETVRYKIENGTSYKLLLDSEEIYTDLYLGLDEKLFDLKGVFELLNSKSTIIDRKEEDNKSYTYQNINGYNFIIDLNDTEIKKITIENEVLKYEFSFEY